MACSTASRSIDRPSSRGRRQGPPPFVNRFRGSNHIDSINRPRPEERAPKSGLPDFGIPMVSKSATADFDSRVSKDGRRPRRIGPSFETPCCARLLTMRSNVVGPLVPMLRSLRTHLAAGPWRPARLQSNRAIAGAAPSLRHRHQLEDMAVRVLEVDAAAAVPIVEPAVVETPGRATIVEAFRLDPAEDRVELPVIDVERIVMGSPGRTTR